MTATTPSAIAVDAGGSTSRAVLVTRDGDCGAVVRSGPGNPVSGAALAAANIADACEAAMAGSDARPQLVLAAVAGVLARDFAELPQVLAERGLPTRLVLVSDLLGAYFSGTAAPDGSVLIVGTGAVAARVSDGRLTAVRDGLGWLLGDDGSGFWMGHQVVRAVAADLDARHPPTALTPRVLERLGEAPSRRGVRPRELSALLTWAQSRRPVELAEFAALAAELSASDAVAHEICATAASHVLATLGSLPGSTDGPVVVGGSVLGPSSPVGREVLATLGGRARRVSDGVAGAALLAIRELDGAGDEAALSRLLVALHG